MVKKAGGVAVVQRLVDGALVERERTRVAL